MNTDTYCKNIRAELKMWEMKLGKALNKIDAIPSINKYKMLPIIEDFHIMAIEMKDRIETLKSECLEEGLNNKVDEGRPDIGMTLEDAETAVGSGNFGG